MEADPLRGVFLDEFDALADYVAPAEGQVASPAPEKGAA